MGRPSVSTPVSALEVWLAHEFPDPDPALFLQRALGQDPGHRANRHQRHHQIRPTEANEGQG